MSYRLRDMFLALLGIIFLSPIFLLIILCLWLTQKHIFFFQERPGLYEIPFTMIKFSTMNAVMDDRDEAEAQRERLTAVGRILRACSLDELPQLLNVLRGDMAIVGPRPLLMEYLPMYTEEERERHSILPGITGWAQVNGRNLISFKEKFQYDLWYVENRSHLLDAKILLLTAKKIFQREGVYADAYTTAPKFDGTN